jgi:aspartyl/asparaginyl beta-hydroxylase (cupin superfamily)
MTESKFRYITDEECDKIQTISKQIQKLSYELLDIATKESQRAFEDNHIHTHEGRRLHRGYLNIYRGADTCIGAVNDCRKKQFLSNEEEE